MLFRMAAITDDAGMRMRMPPAYWRFWTATGIDNIGEGVYVAAVPLLAITLTTDPRLVSLVSTAAYLPWLLVSLAAGSLVDRVDRVSVMWRTQVVAAVIVGAMAIAVACNAISIPLLAFATFGLGTCAVIFGNAAQSTLPDLVPEPLLHKANGHQQTIITAGQLFVGPPLGSLLFAISAAVPFGIDALSFVIAAGLIATLPRRPALTTTQAPIKAGVQWLWSNKLMRTLATLLALNSFGGQLANATLVLLATQTLHVSTKSYGLLLTAAACGSILGGLVNAWVVHHIGALHALIAGLTVNVVAFFGIGLSPGPLTLGAFLAVNGFATTLWNVVTVSLRQQLVPRDLLGRVTSVYKLLGWGLIPLGTLLGGLVAHELGLRAPYQLAGALRGIGLAVALPALVVAIRSVHRAGSRETPPLAGSPDRSPTTDSTGHDTR